MAPEVSVSWSGRVGRPLRVSWWASSSVSPVVLSPLVPSPLVQFGRQGVVDGGLDGGDEVGRAGGGGPAQVEDVRTVRAEARGSGGDRVDEPVGGGDERAGAVAGDDEPLQPQPGQRPDYRDPAHAELTGECPFRGQAQAGAELAVRDASPERGRHLVGHRHKSSLR
jgi:hypothetical protein